MVATGHPQKKNNDGNTALHLAARMGHVGSLGVGFLHQLMWPAPPIFQGGFLFKHKVVFVNKTVYTYVCLSSSFLLGIYIFFL